MCGVFIETIVCSVVFCMIIYIEAGQDVFFGVFIIANSLCLVCSFVRQTFLWQWHVIFWWRLLSIGFPAWHLVPSLPTFLCEEARMLLPSSPLSLFFFLRFVLPYSQKELFLRLPFCVSFCLNKRRLMFVYPEAARCFVWVKTQRNAVTSANFQWENSKPAQLQQT